MANSGIASRWRKLSGEDSWDGLLHPLDLDLRRYIIHYGQRTGSVGDLFNYNKHGQLPKERFFQEAGLVKGNEFKYYVSHYIYAVTTDDGKRVLGRRDILIARRGTVTFSEWLNNLNSTQQSAEQLFGTESEAMVHSGFLSLYTETRSDSIDVKTSAIRQVREALKELLTKYKDEEASTTVTRFSLGGVLATLNAMDSCKWIQQGQFISFAAVHGDSLHIRRSSRRRLWSGEIIQQTGSSSYSTH
ncbi:phospholipase A1-II 6-like [Hibiscus syriacus]|uniref:phospholipase A1-II 6-like n=1 Tax=Hibiscus syriacus TaxID=106335 RepID=UPI0019233C46|nr:phospholipase A1-II 6-like [Hibiscus syriacus]